MKEQQPSVPCVSAAAVQEHLSHDLMRRSAAEKEFEELCALFSEDAEHELELSEYFDCDYQSIDASA